ncbi:formate hydrogenlyase subunit 3/Multisubunit Na+/H+ antiporter, MnhD subunit [Serpentinimonas raichei]|jgi:multicomponent Na+:H+ antiporter subunit D|uniref:Formate hydrogenlyase subunit 3/Multisubunit Na+/H+ antiporter, MnhD subunit n=1 Tax=Serpentinimonas raichei TaxID=1458425 RepID=A0A060NGK8_9BURK|nr:MULTISPECIES: proton-conducting transporter membrane subunit [Serpentinimonas]BAO80846.1 formate hydrogenlyase subunit 3/Multisubunit Na+/H+ antiporter, MnhD subunit [Serpentinimonas raichei]
MTWLAATPVLVPMVTMVATALAYKNPRLQAAISLLGALAFLVCALALVAVAHQDQAAQTVFGDWGAPYGIEFAIDRLSAAMVLMAAFMGTVCLIFMLSDADTGSRHPMVLPLLHGVLCGAGGAFATADLFNLYVWFEVMLVAAMGLFALGGRVDQLDATFKYYVLNIFGTLFFLIAVAMVYAATGHLNYTAVAQAIPYLSTGMMTLLAVGLLLSFLIKSAAFPVFAWLPASYHTLPAPVLALFAAVLTKVGVYAVLRTLGDIFVGAPDFIYVVLGWIAVGSMVFGVIGAAYHWDMRRILAFHSVSQIGYILLAVALASQAGHAAALFYILHHSIVKANLFLIAAIIWRLSGDYDLRRIGGLYKTQPLLAVLFFIMAMSLVGIPPFTGFWAKVMVVQETIAQGQIAWTFFALLVGMLTLYSMAKIWMEAFWKPHPNPAWRPPKVTQLGPAWIASLGLAVLMLVISLYPQPLIEYAQAAAKTLGAP